MHRVEILTSLLLFLMLEMHLNAFSFPAAADATVHEKAPFSVLLC